MSGNVGMCRAVGSEFLNVLGPQADGDMEIVQVTPPSFPEQNLTSFVLQILGVMVLLVPIIVCALNSACRLSSTPKAQDTPEVAVPVGPIYDSFEVAGWARSVRGAVAEALEIAATRLETKPSKEAHLALQNVIIFFDSNVPGRSKALHKALTAIANYDSDSDLKGLLSGVFVNSPETEPFYPYIDLFDQYLNGQIPLEDLREGIRTKTGVEQGTDKQMFRAARVLAYTNFSDSAAMIQNTRALSLAATGKMLGQDFPFGRKTTDTKKE
jgi:hypothetical protein